MRTDTLTWEGGVNEFALTEPLLVALEEKSHDKSIGAVFSRLEVSCTQNVRMYSISDVRDTVAFGLEGGGMDKSEAYKKVLGVFSERGLECLLPTAFEVLASALIGFDEDKEKPTVETELNS